MGLHAAGDLNFVDGAPDTPITLPDDLGAPLDGDISGNHGMPRWQGLPASSPRSALPLLHCSSTTASAPGLRRYAARRSASTADTDPLYAPGEADLTSQVDFAAFTHITSAHGLACDGPVPQAEFLGLLGIVERASRLMAANPAKAAQIETAIARLMAPGGMGTRLFLGHRR